MTGLDPSVAYTITFYSCVSRSDSRETKFTINSIIQTVEPGNNTAGGTVTFNNIFPDSSGKIEAAAVRVSANIGNNWILNGMEITYTVPEPASIMLSALGLIPLPRRR